MLNPKPIIDSDAQERVLRTRQTLLRRLADVVCLPSSRVNSFERAVVGDLMVEVLGEASIDERRRVAERLAHLAEVPSALLRMLLRDDVRVASPLLEDSSALSDGDLLGCVLKAGKAHRVKMASRRGLSELVCDALIEHGEPEVILALLKNTTAQMSQGAIEGAVALSQSDSSLITPLLRRSEMKPSSAYAVYWWADADQRMVILQRFAVSRQVLQESVEDVFGMAAVGGGNDPIVRKALQFIERRQRNRAALENSAYASLEEAVEASLSGMSKALVAEIAHLSGIKPMTAAKILTDPLGDSLAILCKATGLSRKHMHMLWRAMRRPEVTPSGELDPRWDRSRICYEMLAVDRAQTVLRYWNWALSSSMTPSLLRAVRAEQQPLSDEYSLPERVRNFESGEEL